MTNIKLYDRDTIQKDIDKLREEGCNIWSISRLNNYNTCPRQYYLTYIEHAKQKQGIYSFLGSALHSDYEDLYNGVTDKLTPNHFSEDWLKAEIFSINFPSNNIKNNYKKDLDFCYKHYNKMNGGKFLCELGFILKIDEKNYMTGFIDLIEFLGDNKINIYDFKSSAMFKDKKLISAARQLAIYQMAMEQLYGLEVVSNAWIMAKYSDIVIGDYKPIMAVQNKDIVKRCETTLKRFMKKKGIDDTLIDMYITMCYSNGDLDCLPEEIKNKIKIETHIKYYDVDEECKNETMQYIKETINIIESKDKNNKEGWNCEINEFFCSNLCSFGETYCKYKN